MLPAVKLGDGRASSALAGVLLGAACTATPATVPRLEREPPIASAPADAATTDAATRDPRAPGALVGRWRVVGCETSPQDPADCARGEIVFTAGRVTVEVAASDRVARPYRLVSRSTDRIVLDVDGQVSEIALDARGAASWRAPGLGGRVGRLSFVRAADGSR